jgi:hypothetical protein
MQDFYEYSYRHMIAPSAAHTDVVMDEAQYDELFSLFDRDDLLHDCLCHGPANAAHV